MDSLSDDRKSLGMMTSDDRCMVMANPLLSVRIPAALMEEIAAAAIAGNKSQVVIDILKAHFNPAPEDEIGQLRRRLEVVEAKFRSAFPPANHSENPPCLSE